MVRSNASSRSFARTALAGFLLALAAVAAAMVAGLGTRMELWSLRTGFAILSWAAWGGLVAAVLSLIGCFMASSGGPRRGLGFAALGLILGVLTFTVPSSMRGAAEAAAPVWDITTDFDNPPSFVASIPLRGDAADKPGYRRGAFADIQRRAYPDIGPVKTAKVPKEAFKTALEAAQSQGWDIVAVVPAEGRIEAVATTFWFGFKEDVVIRVHGEGQGSRIDIRAYARQGQNDAGTNAKQVRGYLAELKRRFGGR